jgi:hypothetical protein
VLDLQPGGMSGLAPPAQGNPVLELYLVPAVHPAGYVAEEAMLDDWVWVLAELEEAGMAETAAAVAGPTTPSGDNPWASWKFTTAVRVP